MLDTPRALRLTVTFRRTLITFRVRVIREIYREAEK